MSQTVQQTADAILALINSQPRTPTKDEIVAIIANAMPAPDVGDSSEQALPAPGMDGHVRHYTGADVTLTPGIERMDALVRQLKAQKAGALKHCAETVAALRAAYVASDWHRALSAYFEERGGTGSSAVTIRLPACLFMTPYETNPLCGDACGGWGTPSICVVLIVSPPQIGRRAMNSWSSANKRRRA